MTKRILAINPGSTSTKIAVYEDLNPIYMLTFSHSPEELIPFKKVADQFEWRRDIIVNDLEENGIPLKTLDAVIGRGGILRPVESGVFEVNDAMVHDLRHSELQHASNLGGLIARYIGDKVGIKAFIADPVVVDEMIPYARISGLPELPRVSVFHALNQKAIARRYAKENETKYEDLNLVVCHMGGGITVSAHRNGKVIDTTNALNGCGPFSPERAGTLPPGPLVNLCFSGKYTEEELLKKIHGRGGLVAHLGTTSIPEILDRVDRGDLHAMLIIRAMCYTIAKEIGAMSTALCGNVDAILLTGGVAHSKRITDYIAGHCNYIAPIYVYPGENELLALAQNALGVLDGELAVKVYTSALPDDPANINDTSRPSKLREWLSAARFSNFSTKRKLSAMREYLRSWRKPSR
ncbi:MAG: butyrate kinase [Muribaculaceae bacterium]|nr:butyrate kinase [Muribaculaceae bacterium]